MKKIIASIIVLLVLCLSVNFGINIKVNASTSNISIFSESDIEELKENGEFSSERILVVLNSNITELNKVYTVDDFPEIELDSIKELTDLSRNALLEQVLSIDLNNFSMIINAATYKRILSLKLKNPTKENVLRGINELMKRDDVSSAEVDSIIYKDTNVVTNDTYYVSDSQWSLKEGAGISIDKAWEFTKGSNEVVVGIIDSGIDSAHSDLVNRVDTEMSVDFSLDNPEELENVTDDDGHGTHVAGIIGAQGNNSTGISGINQNVKLVSLRINPSNDDTFASQLISAIDYAIKKEIPILNNSNGTDNFSGKASSITALEAELNNYPGLFVTSAGNGEKNNDTNDKRFPSNINASNLISVGSHNSLNEKSWFSNWGQNSVDIFAPGDDILSTYPTNMCINNTHDTVYTNHIANGYHEISGTSMATPHVTGVAALLLSINKNLSTSQLVEAILNSAENITISVKKSGASGFFGGTEEQNVLKLNAFKAVKYVLEHFSNTEYTLSNYSSTINASKTITSDASYFDELNGFYKLNVIYSKNYEFISSSTSGLEVTLYDEDFTEIPFNDLDSTSNKVHFIENLSTGTYYLKTKYDNEESIGTISTQIVSRTTAYIGIGDNDVLLNTYNSISEYVYTNNQGPGIYRFKLNGTTIDETFITYPLNSLTLYTDSTRSIEVEKLYFDEDEILVYLPSNGAYYLNINLNEANYSSLFISVDSIEKNNIDYINGLTSVSFNILFENKNSLYHYEEVTIKQKSEVQLDIITNGTITDSIPVYVYSRIYDDVTRKYNLVETFIGEITPIDRAPVYTLVLEAGTYYFGYKNNEDNVNINFALRRMVDYNMNMEGILVADPDSTGYDLGTEVLINERECDEYTITEGFTRNIYLMVEDRLRDPMSRLDYDWYSSNESVAIVTNYGTVLAMPVTIDTEVTIYAVLKDDPKIVYYRTFTVLNDEEENLEEIILNMSYSYSDSNGTYQLELNNTNCPYPMIQYYSWNIRNESEETVTMNQWGEISSTGICTVQIEGIYNLNTRVRLYITLTIE